MKRWRVQPGRRKRLSGDLYSVYEEPKIEPVGHDQHREIETALLRLELRHHELTDHRQPPYQALRRRFREAETDVDRAEVLIDAQRKLDAYKEVMR